MRIDRIPRQLLWSLLVGVALGAVLAGLPGDAQGKSLGPDRQKTFTVTYTLTEWWLVDWTDNQTVCEIFVEHDFTPSGSEIFFACGDEVFEDWQATEPCDFLAEPGEPGACEGLYLHRVARTELQREVIVDLPPATVGLSLTGCEPLTADHYCETLPWLQLQGVEPLPNEEVVYLRGTVEGVLFECEGSRCEIPLQPTRGSGAEIVFWAASSFGDTSPRFEARVRVVEGRSVSPDLDGWFVDVLSSQWQGEAPLSCSAVWEALPPVGGPPAWLTTPESFTHLATDEPYVILAGSLIQRGAVPEASDCPAFGLLESGAASPCGLEKARPLVEEWQNRFDELILEVAAEKDIPAQLMKNFFAHESQFWPGLFEDVEEAGLGQMTADGTDAALLWNEDFYTGFCPLVLSEDTCREGYLGLEEGERVLLRAALFNSLNAFCPDCPLGVDLTQADYSVGVFAEALQANCEQVGQIIRNITEEKPGDVSGYEDLWRFTLANYNAGSGCFAAAVGDAWHAGGPLDWAGVSSYLEPACQGAIEYVTRIAVDRPPPEPDEFLTSGLESP